MRRIAVLSGLLLTLFSGSALATTKPSTGSGTFVWSGAKLQWGYNHRYNRLGDYVKASDCTTSGQSCKGTVVQTAASGVGPDTAKGTSYWWQVQASRIGFANATVDLSVRGKKGTEIKTSQTVDIPVSDSKYAQLRARDNYSVLLNGFDLISKGESAKLLKFRVYTTDIHYDKKQRAIAFRVHARVKLNCSSQECTKTERNVSYKLKVQTLVVAGDDNLAVTTGNFGRSYSWKDESRELSGSCGVNFDPQFTTPGDELSLDPIKASLLSKTSASNAFLGFRSLSFTASVEPHLIAFDSAIIPGSYDGQRYNFDLDLLFKSWARNMQSTASPFSQCSYAEPGSAKWGANVALVQIKSSAAVTHESTSCTVNWPGFNLTPTDHRATCVKKRSFLLTQ